jgi:hypothetical protein
MSIHTIGFDQAPQGMGRSQDRLDRLTSQAGSAAQSGGVTSDKAGELTVARTAPEFQRLTALHERSNAVAATIRTMDQAMEAAGTTIDAMKKELEVVTKTYPPFPPGSEDRVRRLRSYAALRAMIDKLTIPPEEDARTLSDPKQAAAQAKPLDEWTLEIGPNGIARTVQKEQVHTGPLGLRLPELNPPETVTDQDISQAVQQLDDATAKLHDRRVRLREQTYDVPGSSFGGGMAESAAEGMSGSVRRLLADQSNGLSSNGTTQLEQLLG